MILPEIPAIVVRLLVVALPVAGALAVVDGYLEVMSERYNVPAAYDESYWSRLRYLKERYKHIEGPVGHFMTGMLLAAIGCGMLYAVWVIVVNVPALVGWFLAPF